MKKCFLLLGTLLLLLTLTACGSGQASNAGSTSVQSDVQSTFLPEADKSDAVQPADGSQESSPLALSSDSSQPEDAGQPEDSAGQDAVDPEPPVSAPVVVTKPAEPPRTTQSKPLDPPAQPAAPESGSASNLESKPEKPEESEEPDKPEEAVPPKATKETASAYIGRSVSSLISAIGEPNGRDYAPSCMGDGEDGELFYDGFTVYTYRIDGQETVQDVL